MSSTINKIKRKISKICQAEYNVDMSQYSSIKCACISRVVAYPSTLSQIVKLLHLLRANNMPYIILGNMTNVLLHKFDGVMIVLHKYDKVWCEGNVIVAEAGCNLARVCSIAMLNGLGGMEALSGIPGSVGGAVVMNAGAHGVDISAVVSSVVVIIDGKVTHYRGTDCGFGYRKSRFDNSVILMAEFTLTPKAKDQVLSQMREYNRLRADTQPLDKPSLGCTFANAGNLSIGKALDQDGYKGYHVGGAEVSTKHANFIINTGNATTDDVLKLINVLKEHLNTKYGIDAHTEIKIVGGDT